MKRFVAKIILETDCKTLKGGMEEVRKTIKSLGLKAEDIKPLQSRRTLAQNNALHLLFTQLADELNEKGLDMRTLIR